LRKLLICIIILAIIVVPVMAEDITAPPAPEEAEKYMPDEPQSFSEGLVYIIKMAISDIEPELASAGSLCATVIAVSLLYSVTKQFLGQSKYVADLVATVLVGLLLLLPTNTMIGLGRQTVENLSNYGKLLIPVMTTSLAAEGAVTTSGALYGGTTAFSAMLNGAISNCIIPLLYIYLCLSLINSILSDDSLKRLRDLAKGMTVWSMKTIMYIYTAYMTITGVISGTVDASALKATKLAISTAVPIIGGVLSDASETVLLSAGITKNAVGIYGLLVMISLWIGPFIKIGTQYLLLKLAGMVAGLFASKQFVELLTDFTSAMGMVLSMIGVQTLLLIVSTVCFMRGVT
jgi:stage III sporulation protein AE